MLRLWGKIIKNHKIISQYEITYAYDDISYENQLKYCIEHIAREMDIQKPYWLPNNLKEYNRYKKTSFTQDNFIEEIDFNKLEIEVLEE